MNLGLKHSQEARRKMSKYHREFYANGGRNNFHGKHHTEEANEKNRLAHLGKTPWNKGKKTGKHSWNYGKPISEETRKKLQEVRKKQIIPKEVYLRIAEKLRGRKRPAYSRAWIEKIRQANIGKKHSEETKKKIALSKIGKRRDKNGKWLPKV